MRWAVLTGADRVARGHVDDVKVLQGAHTDGESGVQVEHEEGGGYWQNGLRCGGSETVRYGGHDVFADAEMDVSSYVTAVENVNRSQIRWIEGHFLFVV